MWAGSEISFEELRVFVNCQFRKFNWQYARAKGVDTGIGTGPGGPVFLIYLLNFTTMAWPPYMTDLLGCPLAIPLPLVASAITRLKLRRFTMPG